MMKVARPAGLKSRLILADGNFTRERGNARACADADSDCLGLFSEVSFIHISSHTDFSFHARASVV